MRRIIYRDIETLEIVTISMEDSCIDPLSPARKIN